MLSLWQDKWLCQHFTEYAEPDEDYEIKQSCSTGHKMFAPLSRRSFLFLAFNVFDNFHLVSWLMMFSADYVSNKQAMNSMQNAVIVVQLLVYAMTSVVPAHWETIPIYVWSNCVQFNPHDSSILGIKLTKVRIHDYSLRVICLKFALLIKVAFSINTVKIRTVKIMFEIRSFCKFATHRTREFQTFGCNWASGTTLCCHCYLCNM